MNFPEKNNHKIESSEGVKISVITATWNCESTLQCTLDSFSAQKYINKEHVIVDGLSSDGTLSIINANLKKIDVFVSEKDNGIYDALNKGIHKSTGDVVGFLHADDWYASNHVLDEIAKVFQDPTICAVYGDLEYVSQTDSQKIVRSWSSYSASKRKLKWGWMPAHPTLYVRKEWYEKIAYFDTSFKISADYLSILKIFSGANFNSQHLPFVFVKMRLGGASNKSIKAILQKMREDWRALRQSNFTIISSVVALLLKNLRKIPQFL